MGLDRELFRAYADRIKHVSQPLALCTTQTGLIGLIPKTAVKGDKIAVLFGRDHLVVLRVKDDGCYKIIGLCYVEGIMQGEAVKHIEISVQDIALCLEV
jgi:hypothetical protein